MSDKDQKTKDQIEALEKNQMTLNENLNILDASYTNSMKLITASLERLLRRVRKLEKLKRRG